MPRTRAKKRDYSASLALLWGEQDRPSRGPKPSLTPERIVAGAIGIADAEGLDALSMQRIAATFDVSTMALYHYIPGKAELIDLMVDAAGGPPGNLSDIAGGWRPRITEWARRCWDLYRQHPWILAATASRRQLMGPNQLAWLDSALSTLSETGLSAAQQHDVFVLVVGHVRNLAQQLADDDEHAEAEWADLTAKVLRYHALRFPALAAAIAEGAFAPRTTDPFDFGLDRILDGVAVLIEQTRTTGARRAGG